MNITMAGMILALKIEPVFSFITQGKIKMPGE